MTDIVSFILSMALQLALIGLEVNRGQLAPDQGDHLWMRLKWSTVCWYVVPSKYPEGPKPAKWESAYDAIYTTQQYHIAQGNVKPGDGSGKPLCDAKTGADTSLLYPVAAVPVPNPVITVGGTPSSLVSAEGVWTFGPAIATGGNSILLNGVATGGFGAKLQLSNGKVYTFTLESLWYQWNGKWIAVSTPVSSS